MAGPPGPCGSGLFFVPVAPSTAPRVRCVALIDGFNLYHAIDDCPHFHAYKWLNPVKLAGAYLQPSKDVLVATFFFTAVPPWNQAKRERHERLLKIYEDLGVIICPGKFMPTQATCRLCGSVYSTYQEKMTDINITLELLRMGRDDIADRIYLVTGDNDQAAAVRAFRGLYPEKEVVIVLPPYRKANELIQCANRQVALSRVQLGKSQLDDPYVFVDGKRQFAKPDNWTNAKEPPPGWQPRENGVLKWH